MNKENIIQTKSYDFAIKIIKTYKELTIIQKEFILSKQLIRSGTSIGANIEEAIGAQSKKDFISKISIAYKEARESHYWIRLLTETNYLRKDLSKDLLVDIEEVLKIISSILKTLKNN